MNIDPNIQLHIRELFDIEREKSNTLYALKIVERIVFSALGIVGVGILGAFLKLVLL